MLAGASAASAASATAPPRKTGVTDGIWDKQDAEAVKEALQDADKIARQFHKYGSGEVVLGRSLEELQVLVKAAGQPAFRAKQLRDGVLQGARNLGDITNLPKSFRAQLQEQGVHTGRSVVHHVVTARDGTRKFLLQLFDGLVVEAVGIPVDDTDKPRLTVCVSSQVGCPMRCTFCATGKGGFARNLLPHEICDQVMTVQEQFGQRVSNVVFMGMGEPLLNLPSVLRAYEILNKDLGIGARHITISTVGVPNAIARLAARQLQSTLAVSIHAPTQALREQVVPSARAYPLEALMQDCTEYFRVTGRRVTFEYTLLAGVNDSPQHAEQLAALLRRHDADMRSHVNVIPWNPVDESEFKRPTKGAVAAFVSALEQRRVPVSAASSEPWQMLEGLYTTNPPSLGSSAPTLHSTATAALLGVASQPAGVLHPLGHPQHGTLQPLQPLPLHLFQQHARQQQLNQQQSGPPTVPRVASSVAAAGSDHSGELEALVMVGCSRREAEVAWDLLTLWRLMRLGCDPAYGQYHLPLQRYTRQPALILRLQACRSEKHLAKYVVRLVHAYRKKAGQDSPPQQAEQAQQGQQKRTSVEEGVQLMNQLLRLLADGQPQEQGQLPGLQQQQQSGTAAAPRFGLPQSMQQDQSQVPQHQRQQPDQEKEQRGVPALLAGHREALHQQPAGPQQAGGTAAELWGQEVVMGMPHAVLLDQPGRQLGLGAGAGDLGESAESGILGLPRTGSVGDFLN
ncbi:hypothetical protein N2152v2_010787 [Parachlorella kessleri]